ncbi:hypothetical protein VP468E531_P0052 [Vibrio phage 468E53-1]|nr:hypothetical protein VP468E531_P0052 [Vibrio phage 468E53-1]
MELANTNLSDLCKPIVYHTLAPTIFGSMNLLRYMMTIPYSPCLGEYSVM